MTADLLLPGVDELDPATVDDLTALIRRAHRQHGAPLPALRDPAWRQTPVPVRAGVIAAAALLHLLDGTEAALRQRHLEENVMLGARLRAASADVATATDWRAVASRPSAAELDRRRSQPGPALTPKPWPRESLAIRWVPVVKPPPVPDDRRLCSCRSASPPFPESTVCIGCGGRIPVEVAERALAAAYGSAP